MLMNDLLKTGFFSLLSENSQEVTNKEMQYAYESFVEEVKPLNQSEENYITNYRTLSLTRIEFQLLQTQILYEQGEKCA